MPCILGVGVSVLSCAAVGLAALVITAAKTITTAWTQRTPMTAIISPTAEAIREIQQRC
jgi:hypothetical protein